MGIVNHQKIDDDYLPLNGSKDDAFVPLNGRMLNSSMTGQKRENL